MRQIRCNHCGKYLFDTDKSDGTAGSEAMRKGFIFKIPALYGIEGCFFFCSKECNRKWAKENITVSNKKDGDKSILEIKEKIPSMVDDTCKAANEISKFISSVRDGSIKIPMNEGKFDKSKIWDIFNKTRHHE